MISLKGAASPFGPSLNIFVVALLIWLFETAQLTKHALLTQVKRKRRPIRRQNQPICQSNSHTR